MRRNYKYALKLSRSQAARLDESLEIGRALYNNALAERKDTYEKEKKSLTYQQQCELLTQKKKTNPELTKIPSQVAQQVLKQLDCAYRSFFQKRARRPKFKKFGENISLLFPQSVKVNASNVQLTGALKFQMHMHRPIPDGAKIKQARIKKECDKYFVVLSLELAEPCVSKVQPVNVVGCDLGIETLATLSDGTEIRGECFSKKNSLQLKKSQKQLSKKKSRSIRRQKALMKVKKIQAKIERQRNDFLHKVSHDLAQHYDGIIFEDMKMDFMNSGKFKGIRRKSYDLSLGKFRDFCKYKLEERGKWFILVDPKGTTQRCSQCGHVVPKELGDRMHECAFCGFRTTRDHNSALEICRLGTSQIHAQGDHGEDTEASAEVRTGSLNCEAPWLATG